MDLAVGRRSTAESSAASQEWVRRCAVGSDGKPAVLLWTFFSSAELLHTGENIGVKVHSWFARRRYSIWPPRHSHSNPAASFPQRAFFPGVSLVRFLDAEPKAPGEQKTS